MVCIVGQHDIIAQAKWITITDHKMEEANISASTLIYEDPSGLLTLEDIIKGDQIVFNSSTEPVPNFGVTKSTIWARLDIMHKVRGRF